LLLSIVACADLSLMLANAEDSEDDDALLAAVAAVGNTPSTSTQVHAGVANHVQGHLAVAKKTITVSAQDLQRLTDAFGHQQQSQHQLPPPQLKQQRSRDFIDAVASQQRTEHGQPTAAWIESLTQQDTVASQPLKVEQQIALQQNTESDPKRKRNSDMISAGMVESQRKATDQVRMAHFYELIATNFQQTAQVQWARICDFGKEYTKD
jgi:hypothetical protein